MKGILTNMHHVFYDTFNFIGIQSDGTPNYKPHVTIDEGPTSVKLLIIGQQELHVGLQQEADLLLSSSLAFLLFFLMLFLPAEYGVEVLCDGQAHHQICRGRQKGILKDIQYGCRWKVLYCTNNCLSVCISEAVQIITVGWVHAILHHTSQFPLPCPGEISLKQIKPNVWTTSPFTRNKHLVEISFWIFQPKRELRS